MSRIGCAFCFETILVPAVEPGREATRCRECPKCYHADCWAGAKNPGGGTGRGRCVGMRCPSTQAVPADDLPPTTELDLNWMAAETDIGAPPNSPAAEPLGMSGGVVGDFGGSAVRIRNNTAASLPLPLVFGPPWADVSVEPDGPAVGWARPDAEPIILLPGGKAIVRVQARPVRPLMAEHRVTLYGQELVLTSSPRRGLGLFVGMAIFFALVAAHVVMTVRAAVTTSPGYWWPAFTFALLVAYTGWVSGGWLRAAILFAVKGVRAIDRWHPDYYPAVTVYSWIDAPTNRGGRLAVVVLATFLAMFLLHRALLAWVTVSTLNWMADGILATAAVAAGYLVVVLVVWSGWLHYYGVNPGGIAVAAVRAAVVAVRGPRHRKPGPSPTPPPA